MSVCESCYGGGLGDESVDLMLAALGVVNFLGFAVKGRQGRKCAHENSHRVGVISEPIHELLDVLVEERVMNDMVRPFFQL